MWEHLDNEYEARQSRAACLIEIALWLVAQVRHVEANYCQFDLVKLVSSSPCVLLHVNASQEFHLQEVGIVSWDIARSISTIQPS